MLALIATAFRLVPTISTPLSTLTIQADFARQRQRQSRNFGHALNLKNELFRGTHLREKMARHPGYSLELSSKTSGKVTAAQP